MLRSRESTENTSSLAESGNVMPASDSLGQLAPCSDLSSVNAAREVDMN